MIKEVLDRIVRQLWFGDRVEGGLEPRDIFLGRHGMIVVFVLVLRSCFWGRFNPSPHDLMAFLPQNPKKKRERARERRKERPTRDQRTSPD